MTYHGAGCAKPALPTATCPDRAEKYPIWANCIRATQCRDVQVSVSDTPPSFGSRSVALSDQTSVGRSGMCRGGTTPAVLTWHQAAPGVPVGTTVGACWLLEAGSVSGRFTSCRLLNMRIATLPQWPRMNPRFGCILRTHHSRVTRKIGPDAARLLGLPPMSLPRFAR
jgi:hypothetical protein